MKTHISILSGSLIIILLSLAISAFAPSFLNAFQSGNIEVIRLGTGAGFRFKGMAIDPAERCAYLGSWDKKQVIKVSLSDREITNYSSKYSGRLNGMGCFLKKGKLYALMNEVNDNPSVNPVSVLLIFDVKRRELLRVFECQGTDGRNHFNHVVVDGNGRAYVSNTLKSAIYSVDTNDPTDALREFISHPSLDWVHGIDLSSDEKKLFATSYGGGILFIDVRKRTILPYRDITLAGDDGLKYHKGSLYGAGQNMIRKYTLDPTESSVVQVDTLLKDHEYFNDPRCLEMDGDFLYVLANIELEPVYFSKRGKHSRTASLTDSYILKIPLSR